MKFLFLILLSLQVIAVEKYHSDISKSEKRIRDIKKEVSDINHKFPEELKLFFKELKNDFAVFYDWNGEEVYFQYRKNKFDRESQKITIGLFQGQSYRIKGEFIGVALFEDITTKLILQHPTIYLKTQKDRDYSYNTTEQFEKIQLNQIKDKNSILIYKLISFESTAIDELIY